jgi:hypothetical protein
LSAQAGKFIQGAEHLLKRCPAREFGTRVTQPGTDEFDRAEPQAQGLMDRQKVSGAKPQPRFVGQRFTIEKVFEGLGAVLAVHRDAFFPGGAAAEHTALSRTGFGGHGERCGAANALACCRHKTKLAIQSASHSAFLP